MKIVCARTAAYENVSCNDVGRLTHLRDKEDSSAQAAAVHVAYGPSSVRCLVGLEMSELRIWRASTKDWWPFKKASKGEWPNAAVSWDRFRKFVLGFMIASLVFFAR